MKSFNEYINWEKETGYVKSYGGKDSGGKGGFEEPTKGDRAMIHHTDKNNKKWSSMIPPTQYKPAKDIRTLKKYVLQFRKDVIAKGGKIKKVEMGK